MRIGLGTDRLRAARGGVRGAALVLLALAACRDEGDTLRTVRRLALPAPLEEATLAVDSARRAWIGERGAVWALDSLGAPVARLELPAGVLRVLWVSPDRVAVRSSGGLRLLDARTGEVHASRRESRPRPLARDPRGRWIYLALPDGGVLGLEAATLTPRWGWPEAGAAATALAVSPLGDRVYLALDRDETEDRRPRVQVRDASTGRVLAETERARALGELVAGPAGDLYGATEAEVVALRHAPDGLDELWRADLGRLGLRAPVEVRVSPRGDRVAAFSRSGGGLRLLDTRTGAEVGRTPEAPLDAAFGVGGRLYLLGEREIRVAR